MKALQQLVPVQVAVVLAALTTVEAVATKNVVLRAVTIPQPPFVFVDNSKQGNARFRGLSIDWFNAVLAQVNRNISYELYLVPDGQFGTQTANGHFNGMINEVYTGKADVIVAPLTITTPRTKAVSFANPYMDIGLRVAVLSKEQPPDYFSFMQAFTPRLWGLLFASAVFMGLVLRFLDRYSPYGYFQSASADAEGHERDLNMSNSLFGMIQVLFGGGVAPARNWAGRILQLGYFFFALIILASYTATMASLLTVKLTSTPVTSIDDIRGQRAPFGVLNNSAISSFFLTTPITKYSIMTEYMVLYPNIDTALAALANEDVIAFVHTSVVLDYIANQPPCNLLQVGDLFSTSNYGIPVALGSPLLQLFNEASTTLRTNGVVDTLRDKWFYQMGSCSDASSGPVISSSAMDVTDIGGLFMMLLLCAGVSIVFLGFENLVWKYRTRVRVCSKFLGEHDGEFEVTPGKLTKVKSVVDEGLRVRSTEMVDVRNPLASVRGRD